MSGIKGEKEEKVQTNGEGTEMFLEITKVERKDKKE